MAVLLISFFGLMFLGAPIAFCMITSSMLVVLVEDISLRIIVEKVLTGTQSFTLLAVFF